MNLRLVSRLLGIICLLIGGFMLFSMPWAFPSLGGRNAAHIPVSGRFETEGFLALGYSFILCSLTGLFLLWRGRGAKGTLYRKEAMAVVGLAWVLATLLGALPFYFGKVGIGTHVQPTSQTARPLLYRGGLHAWIVSPPLTPRQIELVNFLRQAGHSGCSAEQLRAWSLQQGFSPPAGEEIIASLAEVHPLWQDAIDREPGLDSAAVRYRLAQRSMSLIDAMFESQSGFSTTGATVISNLEDPQLVPHCLLFWRSSTHFLGGLGIIVLFVAILGHGSAGKALMRAELPGPTQDSSQTRVQHAAWSFAATYVALNIVLTIILRLFKLSWFDAICHAFGTLATGGFSTYNASLGHFQSTAIEMIVVVFMIIAGSNFTLLIVAFRNHPLLLLRDVEWQTYMAIMLIATVLIVLFGLGHGDFAQHPRSRPPADSPRPPGQPWESPCGMGCSKSCPS